MLEDCLKLFQFQRRGNPEHAVVSVEAAVGDEDVTMGIESEEVAKSLDGDGGAGDGILLRNRLPDKTNILMSPFSHLTHKSTIPYTPFQ